MPLSLTQSLSQASGGGCAWSLVECREASRSGVDDRGGHGGGAGGGGDLYKRVRDKASHVSGAINISSLLVVCACPQPPSLSPQAPLVFSFKKNTLAKKYNTVGTRLVGNDLYIKSGYFTDYARGRDGEVGTRSVKIVSQRSKM